jgi:23S rRNA (cytosine1962-C5)-methyltransferase
MAYDIDSLRESLDLAIQRRSDLRTRLADEGTNCYRLLHGISEGQPGLAIDRYDQILLVQTWRAELIDEHLDCIREVVAGHVGVDLSLFWNHRKKKLSDSFDRWHQPGKPPGDCLVRERGLAFRAEPRHRGIDPLLFLDFRAGRRFVAECCAEPEVKTVLNLFAYTCGVGVAAAVAGANEVVNVDFAESSLAVGKDNARLNADLSEGASVFIQGDVFAVLRQFAGLKVSARYGKLPRFEKFAKRQFDLVVLDPPKWAKSPFGVVDLKRDYQSLFKPALLATAPGGRMLVTNNDASVDGDGWLEILRRSVKKGERELVSLHVIEPDEDFPSFDGKPPLKMAALRLR